MQTRRWALWWSFLVCLAAVTGAASAHPLGNFTINRLTKIDTHRGAMHVRYVLDIAEIPTFQILHAAAPDGNWTAAQQDAWSSSQAALVQHDLRIEIDGTAAPLVLERANVRLRPGAAGLSTLYWVGDFTVPLSAGAHRVRVSDGVYAQRRIGWRDVVVSPQREPTRELTVYPNALVGSPRLVEAAAFDVGPSGAASHVETTFAAAAGTGAPGIARTNALSDMFASSNRAPLFVLLTMLVAFGLGALHALEPGHGKALLAFTLVGSRATVRQAMILAASLTFAHTIGVLLLGLVLFFAAGFVSESIYPWITLLSGIAIAIVGARSLARYVHLRAHRVHAHAGIADHHHGDGNVAHSHAVAGTAPIEFRSAVAAAMSGGIAPCPAAIVVMLAALRLHQLGYGLILIVIFSLGLASVLTAIGIAVVHGSGWALRSGRFDRFVAAGPAISASLISVVGAVMVAQGFAAQGVPAPEWVILALAAAAIAGYALTPQHHHAAEAQNA